MAEEQAPPAPAAACDHREREDGVCTRCGHCLHEVILNGVCYVCGSADIDGVRISPKPEDQIIPASRLVRKPSKPES